MGNQSNFSNRSLTIHQPCDFAWKVRGGSACMWYEVANIHLNCYGGKVVSLINIIQGPSSWMWSISRVSHLQKMLFCLVFLAENSVELFEIPCELKALNQPNVSVRQITDFTTKISSYKATILHLHCPACTACSEHSAWLVNPRENKIHIHREIQNNLCSSNSRWKDCISASVKYAVHWGNCLSLADLNSTNFL